MVARTMTPRANGTGSSAFLGSSEFLGVPRSSSEFLGGTKPRASRGAPRNPRNSVRWDSYLSHPSHPSYLPPPQAAQGRLDLRHPERERHREIHHPEDAAHQE